GTVARLAASREHRTKGCRCVPKDGGRLGEARGGDSSAETHTTGLRAKRAEPGPDEGSLTLLRSPGVKVVGGHDTAEPCILRLARPPQQVGWVELLKHGGVAEKAHGNAPSLDGGL